MGINAAIYTEKSVQTDWIVIELRNRYPSRTINAPFNPIE